VQRRPYQYKINRKKRAVTERKGLESDEEEIEDLCAMKQIEEIMHATYDRKTRGYGSDTEEGTPFQIKISVEPTTPCATKTSGKKESFRQQEISRKRSRIGHRTEGHHKNECPTFVQYLGSRKPNTVQMLGTHSYGVPLFCDQIPYPWEDYGVKYVKNLDMIPIIVQ
jgi:hypothetical protein